MIVLRLGVFWRLTLKKELKVEQQIGLRVGLYVLIVPFVIYPEYRSGSFGRVSGPLWICSVSDCDVSLENIDRSCNFDPIGPAG